MKPALIALLASSLVWHTTAQVARTSLVNPLIGTGGHGHTYPGATMPFGMVQLSPDNDTQGWDWCSGYHYSDSTIVGFSHTHLSGTGIGDGYDISLMPLLHITQGKQQYIDHYNHMQEKAAPGYYQVRLQDANINAELTATTHVGVHRYTFPASKDAAIQIDLGFAKNWDKATECFIQQLSPTRYAGYRKSTGWAKKQTLYFAMELSKPASKWLLMDSTALVKATSLKADKVKALLQFATRANEQITVKVSLSTANDMGAVAGLAEVNRLSFDDVRQLANDAWEKELSKVQITTNDAAVLTNFYTALYHTCLAPVTYSDFLGQYMGADQQVHHSKRPVYSVHSLWDTFRANNPLFTLLHPERNADIIQSYLLFYEQSGLLPVWDLYFNETNTMTGYHAVAVIADAMQKNIQGFDYNLAYEAMRASAFQQGRGTDYYRQFGFVPQDKHGWSVSITLEYAYDDWCIAQAAKVLGKQEDYELFTALSKSFRRLFDSATGFFRAKNKNGTWVTPFDPYFSEHGFTGMYIEGTAWQHTFFVPHAIDEYATLLGGKEKLIEKLDSLFTTSSNTKGSNVSNDISGLIGQYAHGNEPSHHIAYIYTALGEPYKSAKWISHILKTMYSNQPDGLSGNEDCGQMSAWYVWSALGMYPMNASSGEYMFGTTLVNFARIQLNNGRQVTIKVDRESNNSKYISSASWNDRPIPIKSIKHHQLMEGGTLYFTLTDAPF